MNVFTADIEQSSGIATSVERILNIESALRKTKMSCNECKYFETVREYKGIKVDRCGLNKGLTWDRNNGVYLPSGYCREGVSK